MENIGPMGPIGPIRPIFLTTASLLPRRRAAALPEGARGSSPQQVDAQVAAGFYSSWVSMPSAMVFALIFAPRSTSIRTRSA
jgi:uncharacterized protein (DUF2062 family)